jgi:hypothetical protein
LRLAALELHESLLTFGRDAKVWLDYLRPDAIIAAVETGSVSEELFELTRRYDGVLMNPELRRVSTAPGFARTRQYLKPWLEEMSGSGEMLTEPDSDESPVDDAAAVGRAAAVESPFDALPGEREPASADAGTPEPSGPSGEDPPADVEVLPAPVELDTPEGVLEL